MNYSEEEREAFYYYKDCNEKDLEKEKIEDLVDIMNLYEDMPKWKKGEQS